MNHELEDLILSEFTDYNAKCKLIEFLKKNNDVAIALENLLSTLQENIVDPMY